VCPMIRPAKYEPLNPPLTRLGYWLVVFVAFATAPLAARIAGGVVVSLVYSPRAYLEGEVYVADWKKGLLSNGEHLASAWHHALALITFVIWSMCVMCFTISAGRLRFLTECPAKDPDPEDEFV
jgi:hypothetical protein